MTGPLLLGYFRHFKWGSYRVFHANCDIRNRHIFTTVNATWNLKIASESSLIAIFSWLNLNIANHKLHPMYNQGWTQVKCQNHRILLCFPGPLALHQAAISKRKELQRWDWSYFEAHCLDFVSKEKNNTNGGDLYHVFKIRVRAASIST